MVAYISLSEKFPFPRAGYVHINEITKAISKHMDVTLYAKSPKNYIQRDKKEGRRTIKYVKFPLTKPEPGDFSCLLKSYRKLKNIKADLVHERFAIMNFWTLLALRKLDVPHILEVNSPHVEEVSNPVLRFFSDSNRRLQFMRCDAIITQTETLKNILCKFTDKKIFVVPNGVDTKKFSPKKFSRKIRRRFVLDNEILITYVGAFMRWHGVHLIPEIAKRLAHHKNIKFLLVGSGPLYEKIKNRSEGLPIKFTGSLSDKEIPKILASSDILVAPFDTSGYRVLERYGFWFCPVKLFEYMASGKAVVSFGYKEVGRIIKNSGLLAKPSNLNEFINKINMLIEDVKLRKRLGSRARKIAENEYSWKKRAEQTIAVYNKVLDNP